MAVIPGELISDGIRAASKAPMSGRLVPSRDASMRDPPGLFNAAARRFGSTANRIVPKLVAPSESLW